MASLELHNSSMNYDLTTVSIECQEEYTLDNGSGSFLESSFVMSRVYIDRTQLPHLKCLIIHPWELCHEFKT